MCEDAVPSADIICPTKPDPDLDNSKDLEPEKKPVKNGYLYSYDTSITDTNLVDRDVLVIETWLLVDHKVDMTVLYGSQTAKTQSLHGHQDIILFYDKDVDTLRVLIHSNDENSVKISVRWEPWESLGHLAGIPTVAEGIPCPPTLTAGCAIRLQEKHLIIFAGCNSGQSVS